MFEVASSTEAMRPTLPPDTASTRVKPTSDAHDISSAPAPARCLGK